MSNPYSHPDEAVRHSYPLAVRTTGVATALNLCLKTMPIMLTRFGILAGFTLASLIWFGLVMGAESLILRGSGGGLAYFFLLAALGVPFGAFRWMKKYILYMLEMAHIAVLTRLITGEDTGASESQLGYGKDIVLQHFGEANILLGVQALITGIVTAFTTTLNWLASFLPIPDLQGPMEIVRKILDNATGYVGDTIFSYNLARGDENKWRSSKDGLIYYAQNWKPILKTAVWALVVEYAITGLVFLVFLGPLWGLGALLPSIGGWAVLFGYFFAQNVRTALVRPICLTMVMLTYHNAVEKQEINLVWDEKLSSATSKFQQLTEQARTWVADKKPSPSVSPAPALTAELV